MEGGGRVSKEGETHRGERERQSLHPGVDPLASGVGGGKQLEDGRGWMSI